MCRNITTLWGLAPPATAEEIEAAARQYVRKVSGVTRPTPPTEAAFEQAVAAVARARSQARGKAQATRSSTSRARATAELLSDLPPRRQPPKADPPLRRPEVRARLAGG